MAFTDHSALFGSVHEEGVNLIVRHLMRQRPSLFNYATPVFHDRPKELFCADIESAPSVLEANNPLFTELEPLPILGAPISLGVDFCLQLTEAQLDLYPGNTIKLPPELGELSKQRFALSMRACAGVACPSKYVIDEFLPLIERYLLAQQELALGRAEEKPRQRLQSHAVVAASDTSIALPRDPKIGLRPPRDNIALPTRELRCFCLELYAEGHFEWGNVSGSQQQWLKPKLDGLEIVDLAPRPMEYDLECYFSTVLRLGILPRVMVPMEKMILDITALLKKQGLQLGKQVTIEPSAVPADVPNNPAVEEDQLKAFIELKVS